jgi:multisubunit Na+/H+ antiporter MnhE subunit
MFGLWLLLVEDYYPSELLAGGAAALIATVAGLLAVEAEQRLGRAFAAQARGLAGMPFAVVRDSVIVLGAALLAGVRLRPLRSAFREIPFAAGDDGPEGAGRRAVAIAVQSVAPNTTVLGIERDRNVMVVHQLVPTAATHPRRRARR